MQHVGKVVGLFDGEIARNLGVAAVDLAIHVGVGIYLVVEHNGHLAVDVGTGEARPLACALVVHLHGHHLALQLLIFALSLGHHVAVHLCLALRSGLDGNQAEAVAQHLVGLHGPQQFQVGGQELAAIFLDDLVNGHGVFGSSHAYHAVVAAAVHLQQLAKFHFALGGSRLGLGGHCRVGLGGRVGLGSHGALAVVGGLHHFVELARDLAPLVGLVELEVGGALQQLLHALGLLDARQLKQNAARALQLLDVGGHNAKLVDTGAQHLVAVVDHRVHLVGEVALDLVGIGIGVVFHLLHVAEELIQVVFIRCPVELLQLVAERLHILVLSRAVVLDIGDCLVEILVLRCGIGQSFQNVGHRNLQGDVHTALQVQTQAELLLAHLLECVVAQPHLLLGDFAHIIVVGPLIGVVRHVGAADVGHCHGLLLALGLVVVGHKRERKVERTNKNQCNGYNFNKTFSLHVSIIYCFV